ncbi:MAG TPA: MFS transporter, partial [Rhodopila sp.]|nr:MFS transporter [Rhodopila sp.]
GWLFYSGSASWEVLLIGWFLMGVAYSFSVTPAGRLLRRSSREEDRPALFAAQFALSHACWLVAYPLAGWTGDAFGQAAAFALLAALAGAGTVIGASVWPMRDPKSVPHSHADLPRDHPHIRSEHASAGSHDFVIDELHPHWPRTGL